MKLELTTEQAEYLTYYLSRSVLFDSSGLCANVVTEEAECGNGLAKKAMETRDKVMKLLTKGGK